MGRLMHFYIPKNIPEDFLKKLGYQPVESVPVEPLEGGSAMHCFDNVRQYLSCNEGEPQFGWIFSMLGKFILKLHAHVVVGLPDQKLLCVTPPEKPLRHVNFIKDSSVSSAIINNRLPTKSFALVNAAIIKQFVQLENDEDTARLLGDHRSFSNVNSKKTILKNDFIEYVRANTGRNDVCFCGSEKKYKNCCR